VSGDVIWQGGMDARLYAVNKEDGSELWQFDLGAQIKASPAVSRGTLVVCGSDGVVYAFRK
jgi:outer membrane protein assembly factor BamB